MPIDHLIATAAKIIAPLWPLQTFIARNPLQGIESLHFEEALLEGKRLFGKRLHEESVTALNRELIKWCEVFLDEGQATIRMPEREKGFYRAWSLLAPFDQKLRSFQKKEWLSSLPATADEAISISLQRLAVPEDQIEEFFKQTLAELPGWVGYIKWRSEWQEGKAQLKNPITLKDFLAVRLAITSTRHTESQIKTLSQDDLRLLEEMEKKEEQYLQELLRKIFRQASGPSGPICRRDAQLVFCIDVRSEQFRMRLEREGQYETFGFAGFFGVPVTVHNYNTGVLTDCCPVLLKPCHTIYEEPASCASNRISRHQTGQKFLTALRGFYQDLKYNFATPFALVETLGIWCGFCMAIRTLMPTKSVDWRTAAREWLMPTIPTVPKIEIPLSDQVVYAESALRIIGLTKEFSQLVVFCGHGSRTENNPYASALDCGACGGNPGGPNGKILAAILNTPAVRASLAEKGIVIPENTLFVGAKHDTTTDEVVIDGGGESEQQKKILEKLRTDLAKARAANCQRRCRTFGLDQSVIDAKNHLLRRSSDWAEVRPEWGLARNAAFIVGPRNLTKELDLEGRCFLHSYVWEGDEKGKSLEIILTAPMVVAEWINTQYLFSTLNHQVYGSGSKITQNVTAKVGVMQGNGSDLMHGLPLQSVHATDDERYHDPIRLQTIVYAPCSLIDSVIERAAVLQTLFLNRWVKLIAIDPQENRSYRWIGEREWAEIPIMAI